MSGRAKPSSSKGVPRDSKGPDGTKKSAGAFTTPVLGLFVASLAALIALLVYQYRGPITRAVVCPLDIPAQAQVIDQRAFNVLHDVPPSTEVNGTQVFKAPGISEAALREKPFHVYDDEFYSILGCNPTLTLIAKSESDPLFHEAVVWFPPTDEVFFVQNAGAPAAGTGLEKSAIIEKVSLIGVSALSNLTDATDLVIIDTVDSNPTVINPNGATNYKGQILFMGEGQGPDITSALYVMNPYPPYNTTVLLDNYFGRQFSSLNDGAVHPRNKDIYFTDPIYGHLQDFRPRPGLQNQIYRFNDRTGAVTVVADGFSQPNGITFSPSGSHAFVADTGTHLGFYGYDFSAPATIYRYDVNEDGTWEHRKVFAYVDSGVPDGVHCDSDGNVYAGCGDGIQVWNPSGKLLGKIYLGTTAANFQFAGDGRMVICAETKLYYATLNASGSYVDGYMGL